MGTRWMGYSHGGAARCAALALAMAFPLTLEAGQADTTLPGQRQSILLPATNRPPDANDRMLMKQQKQTTQNFDAANALRRKQIDDDVRKLLILANDLKMQVDKLGNDAVPERLVREAAVVELLAKDVQARMTMTVGRE